ncbi:MAG: flagellar hook basal-body protein [Firmicutes bacterium]|nr:flagellar hook basal-body protein [Alicyclobacillaceae bacterium]MCL6497311.1 flagellar hook basal-body protein [Bacillota bacterium]
MDGLYTALSGLLAETANLTAVAGNLSNLQSPGYLAESGNVEAAISQVVLRVGGSQGGAILGQRSAGIVYTNTFDLAPGPIEPTTSPSDLALNGDGFFAVRTPSGQVAYTRNGAFTVNAQGNLVLPQGAVLLDTQGNPVTVVPNQPFTVAADGTVQQQGAVVGQIAVVALQPNSVVGLGQALYQGTPGPSQATVVQGGLTQSNVSAVVSAERLLRAESAYQALTQVVNAESNRQKTADGLGTLA